MIDYDKLERKIIAFNLKRKENNPSAGSPEEFMELVDYDFNCPMTTNRKQLELIDVDCRNVTANFDEIIEGLKLIGVVVVNPINDPIHCELLSDELDAEVPEAWDPKDCTTFLSINPFEKGK